jgi:hypothetical protein
LDSSLCVCYVCVVCSLARPLTFGGEQSSVIPPHVPGKIHAGCFPLFQKILFPLFPKECHQRKRHVTQLIRSLAARIMHRFTGALRRCAAPRWGLRSMSSEVVVSPPVDGVCVVKLSAPERLNALTVPMGEEFSSKINALCSDLSGVSAVIITGEGEEGEGGEWYSRRSHLV